MKISRFFYNLFWINCIIADLLQLTSSYWHHKNCSFLIKLLISASICFAVLLCFALLCSALTFTVLFSDTIYFYDIPIPFQSVQFNTIQFNSIQLHVGSSMCNSLFFYPNNYPFTWLMSFVSNDTLHFILFPSFPLPLLSLKSSVCAGTP